MTDSEPEVRRTAPKAAPKANCDAAPAAPTCDAVSATPNINCNLDGLDSIDGLNGDGPTQLDELREIQLAEINANGLPMSRNLYALALCCPAYLEVLTELTRQANTDPLTGLFNHGLFRRQLAKTSPGRTAVIVIDVDGFKKVNDKYGHMAGDRTLVSLAARLRNVLRCPDELYRIGGDEFAAILNVNCPGDIVATAQRLLDGARCVGRTVSIGAALCLNGETGEEVWQRADGALYVAKGAGRDTAHLSPGRLT
jgi:diguanylate cyclase (GGDEF)-like protein